MELVLVRLNQAWLQPALAFAEWLTGGPLGQWCMSWCCPKAVACSVGPFDPCETERCILIGWCFLPWIQGCVFSQILLKFLHSTNFQGTCENSIILDKYACKKC
jgi:hypothetical protein